MIFIENKIIDNISNIARLAGLEIMNFYSGRRKLELEINKKFDQSFVTSADFCAHKIIVRSLNSLTPHIPVISEEALPIWEIYREWDYFWLIDPLDGTREFLARNGEFTVNIALIEYGLPVMGVIYVPVFDILYAADNGQVWKIDNKGRYSKIKVCKSINPMIVMSRHDNYECKRLYDYLKRLKNYELLYIGSSYKFCLVAEGNAQFYPRFSCTKIWDTAAGHIIAQTAGAIINDWHGNLLDYKNINKYFLNPGFQVLLC